MMTSKLNRNLAAEDIEDARDDEVERLLDDDNDTSGRPFDDDDDFFLKGPSGKKTVRFATDKLNDVRVQIAEVTDVMRDNVGRLLDRGDRLDTLQDRSEDLSLSSDQFRQSAGRMRRQMWWQNTKTKLCIGGVMGILILVMLIIIVSKFS